MLLLLKIRSLIPLSFGSIQSKKTGDHMSRRAAACEDTWVAPIVCTRSFAEDLDLNLSHFIA